MVEYAVLLAHNSAWLMSGVAGDVYSWTSQLDSHLLGYAAVGILLLMVASWSFTSKRRY
jgi:hypothetical protein